MARLFVLVRFASICTAGLKYGDTLRHVLNSDYQRVLWNVAQMKCCYMSNAFSVWCRIHGDDTFLVWYCLSSAVSVSE